MTGMPLAATSFNTASSPVFRSFFAASPNAPTPGSITRSARTMSSALPVTRTRAPTAIRLCSSENRLPTP